MPLVENLSERFRANLEFSKRVDIAVAWATSGDQLKWLEDAASEHDTSIRAIVGTYGNATDPDALERLKHIGKLRLVPEGNPMFHPKIYIFRRKKESVAWVGSANFTKGGFEANEEAVFETKRTDSVSAWFKRRWRECGELSPNAIAEYRRRRALNPPARALRRMIGKPRRENDDRLSFLDQAEDWSGFVQALNQCQNWWIDRREAHPRQRWTVLGPVYSWIHTIENVRPVATMEAWDDLGEVDGGKLMGLYSDGELDSGLLGSMNGAAKACSVFRNPTPENIQVRRRIKSAVSRVVNARSISFPGVAIEAIGAICEETRFGIGVATRLLALARPDRIVSVNSRSEKGLARIFPAVSEMKTLDDYSRFLLQLYQEPWFDSTRPDDEFERKLWSMRSRVARLLCLFAAVAGTRTSWCESHRAPTAKVVLPCDREGDEGRLPCEALDTQFARLVHAVPLLTLAENPFVVAEV